MWKRVLVVTGSFLILLSSAAAQESDGEFQTTVIGGRVAQPVDAYYQLRLRNTGDAVLTGVVEWEQQTFLSYDWLEVEPLAVSVPPGSVDTLFVTVRRSLIPNPGPGSVLDELHGVVRVLVDQPTVHDTVGASVWVIMSPLILNPYADTMVTSCADLRVWSHGLLAGDLFGGGGQMAFFDDCDTSDGIPGDAGTYLYEASPILFKPDTSLSTNIYGDGFPERRCFVISPEISGALTTLADNPEYQAVWSSPFLNNDSTIACSQTVIAAKDPALCNSFIFAFAVWSHTGEAYNDLTLGYAWDWDIPSDTAVWNSSGVDVAEGVLWLRGMEVNEPHSDSLECQQNDARFGGSSFIGYQIGKRGLLQTAPPYGGYVGRNETDVVPTGGFRAEELYANMHAHPGLAAQPPSVVKDLHSVMTFSTDYDLGPTDTLIMVYAMTTIQNGTEQDLIDDITAAKQWYVNTDPVLFPSCCKLMGDVNSDGLVNLTDLTCLVGPMFLFWPNPCEGWCRAAGNTNADPNCDITLTDLTLLVNRLFVTFEPLGSCDDFDNSHCD